MASLRRGDHMWSHVSAAGGRRADAGPDCGQRSQEVDGLQLHCDLPDSTASASYPSPDSSEGSDASQVVALRARRGGGGGRRGAEARFAAVDGFLSYMAAVLSGRRRASWPMMDLPFQLCRPLRGSLMVLVSPHAQRRMLAEEEEVEAVSVRALCHPALRERTLRRLCHSGGLQALIDQWGDSSLEELEAFIDSYFQMVWEQTMGSDQASEPDCPAPEEEEEEEEEDQEEEEVLSSIDRKLTKLELLEEIKTDLAELRQSLERSWKAIEELRHKNKQGPNNNNNTQY